MYLHVMFAHLGVRSLEDLATVGHPIESGLCHLTETPEKGIAHTDVCFLVRLPPTPHLYVATHDFLDDPDRVVWRIVEEILPEGTVQKTFRVSETIDDPAIVRSLREILVGHFVLEKA